MHKLLRLLLSAFTLGVVFYGSAHAECSAPDFKNVKFSDIRDLSRYAFLSTVSESDYKSNSQKFKGEMVIPYINVPASGDFQQMKSQLQQVQRMTQIDLNKSHTETLLDIGWSQLGFEAYRECLRAQMGEALIVEHLKGTDPFSDELIASIVWQRRTPSPSKPIESIVCLGCEYNGLKIGEAIQQGSAKIVTLKRRPDSNLSFVVTVDGLVGQFHLPKAPKKPKIRDENWSITASATQLVPSQQLVLPNDTFCWPSPAGGFTIDAGKKNFVLAQSEEFVIGSMQSILIGKEGPQGYAREPWTRRESEKQACWQFEVVSQDKNNGYAGKYNLSVKVIASE